MPALDAVSDAHLQNIYPRLAAKIRKMAEMLQVEGIQIRVVQGLRTMAEQQALYDQGRTKPGKIVTNCQGGHSYHNFGLAVDCCPSTHGPDRPFDPDWNSSHPTWNRMVQVGLSLGLDSGATWRTFKDWPHFQCTGLFPEGAPNDRVRALFAAGSYQAVWDEIDRDLSPVATGPEPSS